MLFDENEMVPLHNGRLNCPCPRIAATFFISFHALELRDDLAVENRIALLSEKRGSFGRPSGAN